MAAYNKRILGRVKSQAPNLDDELFGRAEGGDDDEDEDAEFGTAMPPVQIVGTNLKPKARKARN